MEAFLTAVLAIVAVGGAISAVHLVREVLDILSGGRR